MAKVPSNAKQSGARKKGTVEFKVDSAGEPGLPSLTFFTNDLPFIYGWGTGNSGRPLVLLR
jgi:hypothetical protein